MEEHSLFNLFVQLALGTVMLGTMVGLHAIGLDFIIKRARQAEALTMRLAQGLWKPLMSGLIVVSVFALHVVQMWAWAALYLVLNCPPLQHLSDALYFSTVTYTTLGFGDIILAPQWRMLAGIEAANGFILFGWTTAFIFEVISQLYRSETRKI